MDNISLVIMKRIEEIRLDGLIDSALKNHRVLQESIHPKRSDVLKFAKSRTGIFTISVISMYAITKLSNAIYRIYLKMKIPACSKIVKKSDRRQCIIHYKIVACLKTIERLKSMRNEKNFENINRRILEIKEKIKKLKSRRINTGLRF
jgi:hypothetical protein